MRKLRQPKAWMRREIAAIAKSLDAQTYESSADDRRIYALAWLVGASGLDKDEQAAALDAIDGHKDKEV